MNTNNQTWVLFTKKVIFIQRYKTNREFKYAKEMNIYQLIYTVRIFIFMDMVNIIKVKRLMQIFVGICRRVNHAARLALRIGNVKRV